MVDFNPGLWGWVTLTRFRVGRPASDAALLGALVREPRFEGLGYDVPEPHAADRILLGTRARVHGRYRLSAVSASSYQRTTEDDARRELETLAAVYEDPTPGVRAKLERDVFPLLHTPALYRLADLGPKADAGWTDFLHRFTEFVSVDIAHGVLVLIIGGHD